MGTCRQCGAFGGHMSWCPLYPGRVERERRQREVAEEKAQAARDFRLKYLLSTVPAGVADKIFEKAWREGHADGMYAVEQQYDEIAEIANAIAKAMYNPPQRRLSH